MMWNVADRISSVWSFCTLMLVCWRQINTCFVSVHVYFARNSAALILTNTKQISVLNKQKKDTRAKKRIKLS